MHVSDILHVAKCIRGHYVHPAKTWGSKDYVTICKNEAKAGDIQGDFVLHLHKSLKTKCN